MKLLFENFRTFLTEVSYDEAKKSLDSKKTIKMIKAYNFDRGVEPEDKLEGLLKIFKYNMSALVPDDIEDNQKGTALLWILGVIRDSKQLRDKVLEKLLTIPDSPLVQASRGQLEKFFHYKQFMDQKDLFKIKDFQQLLAVTNRAQPKILAYQDKQKYMDAGEGTEVLRDDEKWFIAAIHNKGAACQLGKGTDWCTAAPGLDYFGQYYKPEDPLFFLEDRAAEGERYQVHFGSDQFMDEEDRPVGELVEKQLLQLLKATSAGVKYESTIAMYEDKNTANFTDDPEMLEQLAARYLNIRGTTAQEIKSSIISNATSKKKPSIFNILSDDKDIFVLRSLASGAWIRSPAIKPDLIIKILENIAVRINDDPALKDQPAPNEAEWYYTSPASVMTSLSRNRQMSDKIFNEIVKFYLLNADKAQTTHADEEGEWDPNAPETGAYAVENLFQRARGVDAPAHAEIFITDKQAISIFKTALEYNFQLVGALLKSWHLRPDLAFWDDKKQKKVPWKEKYPDLGYKLTTLGLKYGRHQVQDLIIANKLGAKDSDLLNVVNAGDYSNHRSFAASGVEATNSLETKKKIYDIMLDFVYAVERGEKFYKKYGKQESGIDSMRHARRMKDHIVYRATSHAAKNKVDLEAQRHVLERLTDDTEEKIRGTALAKLRNYPFIDIRKKQVAESIDYSRFIKDLI